MKFIVRFVVQVAVLIGVVVFAIVFFNVRSDVNDQADNIASTTVLQTNSTVGTDQGRFAPVSLVGGASFNLNAVVAERPVVFWFWAPG